MNRIMMYRRTQSQDEIISPNKNTPALKQRVFILTLIFIIDYVIR